MLSEGAKTSLWGCLWQEGGDMTDIIIPTIKTEYELRGQIAEIEQHTEIDFNLIVTSQQVSAAKNRNIGLRRSRSKLVIMMDDDMTGFYKGWAKDLLKPMIGEFDVGIVSARLCSLDMRHCKAMGMDEEDHKMYPLVFPADKKRVTTACIAFRNKGIMFDENYIGSGWEDTDFSMQWGKEFPDMKILVNNGCILKHINERKNQEGHHWDHNRRLFITKWGEEAL